MKDCETSIEIPSAVVILDKSANNGSQLPARATRLLTRRLQNNATPTNCGTGGSESPRSMDSLPRRSALSASYKTATLNQFNNNSLANSISHLTDSASTATNSAEDLTLLDKSLRNSMLQDVVHFKKQLVRLRRILQETDTLNPFENNNGQFFTTAATTATTATPTTTNGQLAAGMAAANLLLLEAAAAGGGLNAASSVDSKQQENTLIKESGGVALALLEDQRQELADLRRQVVYLQGEITAKDRTIRQQQNLIEKYEAEREKLQAGQSPDGAGDGGAGAGAGNNPGCGTSAIDTISTATQTERLRPLSFGGPEGLARAILCYLPQRSLFVADFFPIRSFTDFECGLVSRFSRAASAIGRRIYWLACRAVFSVASGLAATCCHLLTPRTNCIDCWGLVAPRLRLSEPIRLKLCQIRYTFLCFYRLFARSELPPSGESLQTEIES